jgi:hypothetical protein
MERETRETEWIRRGQVERKVWWFAGFDCRRGCVHDVKGEHGQRGDELLIAVRIAAGSLPISLPFDLRKEHEFGLGLEVTTDVREGRRTMSRQDPSRGYNLMTHHAFRTTEEQIRENSQPNTDCKILACGQCYSGYSGVGAADLFWTPADVDATVKHLLGNSPESYVLHIKTDLWERLGVFLLERQAEALKQRDALPVQCPTCKGHGLVPRPT